MRLVPRRRRCAAALRLARAAAPSFRLSELYRRQERSRVSGALDIATHMVLHTLTKNGVLFDPIFEFDGFDDFVRAYKEGRGILLRRLAVREPSGRRGAGRLLCHCWHTHGTARHDHGAGEQPHCTLHHDGTPAGGVETLTMCSSVYDD